MKTRYNKLLWILFFELILFQAVAQNSAKNENALLDPVSDYFREVNENALIYAGIEQVNYPPKIQGTPYSEKDRYLAGQISYDKIVYESLQFRYNIEKDEIEVLSPGNFTVVLNDRFFDYALTTDSLLIKRASKQEDNKPFSGYYFELYKSSAFELIERNTCLIDERIENKEIIYSFVHSKSFYICKSGSDLPKRIKKENDLLKLLSDRKKEIKQYIKLRRLNFKENPRNFLLEVLKKYEELEK